MLQLDAGLKSARSETEPAEYRQKDRTPVVELREVLERVQHAALASTRAAEDEAELARRVDVLERHRVQVTTKLSNLDKARRAREARLSDAAALLRRLAAG